jgi:glycine/D-amino acid oxidase-like deaminating enzyme
VVVAAGAWSTEKPIQPRKLPVEPVKRQVFAFKSSAVLEKPLPLIIAPSGLYFRTDRGLFLVAFFDDDPVGFDFAWDRKRFQDVVAGVGEMSQRQSQTRPRWRGFDVNRLDGIHLGSLA